MKKWVPISMILCCSILVNGQVYGTEQSEAQEDVIELQSEGQEAAQTFTKEFIGRGDPENERNRQRRSFRYSRLQPTGLYAKVGDRLTIHVNGQSGLQLAVGTPERNTHTRHQLNEGTNTFTVSNEGVIYIINMNNSGSAAVSITGSTGTMPYFDLDTTTAADFQRQMNEKTDAKDVQLVSNKAIVTVSYDMARRFLGDPKVLMEYYDRFLVAQDRVSGITEGGRAANAADRNYQHFVEVSRGYMFATHEYMGFNGDAALTRLLNTNNGWGVWHESGHQRQQGDWTWRGVVEATVNIYSLAAQREITGRITQLDRHFPAMHTYLNSENKDFEQLNNDLKMVMFGQLWNTFGDDFYPVLHQYYRENQQNISSDAERIQHFIVNVSKITGYNMVPYFEQWGFSITNETRTNTRDFLDLPEKIWLNDNVTNQRLPMRKIASVSITEQNVNVNLTDFENNIFQDQQIVLSRNGIYVSELTNKRPFYSFLNGNVWRTARGTFQPNDIVRIEVRNADGRFLLYEGSRNIDDLRNQLQEYLALGEEINERIDQKKLDELRSTINDLPVSQSREQLLFLLETVEQKYLESLIKDIRLDYPNSISIDFSNEKFKEYNQIVLTGNDGYIAEVANGRPFYSRLTGNTWRISRDIANQEHFAIQFRLPHKRYIVGPFNTQDLLLKNELNQLFVSNDQIAPNVTQAQIDALRNRVNQAGENLKERLSTKIDRVQHLFFEQMIAEMRFSNGRLEVAFANDLFRNYQIVILQNNSYMAEVTNGRPFYGQLNGSVFRPSATVISGGTYTVEVRHSSGRYRVRSIISN